MLWIIFDYHFVDHTPYTDRKRRLKKHQRQTEDTDKYFVKSNIPMNDKPPHHRQRDKPAKRPRKTLLQPADIFGLLVLYDKFPQQQRGGIFGADHPQCKVKKQKCKIDTCYDNVVVADPDKDYDHAQHKENTGCGSRLSLIDHGDIVSGNLFTIFP